MSFFQQFKEFAIRGNVLDLVAGGIIGGAFGKIVFSFINDIGMPPLGILIGGGDRKHLSLVLKEVYVDSKGALVESTIFN